MIKQLSTAILTLLMMGAAIAAQDNRPEPELVDEFGGSIPGEDLLARMDGFAFRLQKDPAASGLILGYGPAGDGSGTADFQINSIKGFLVENNGIDPGRLYVVNAGRHENLTGSRVRLWLIPPGAELPKEQQYKGEAGTVKGKVGELVGWEYFGGLGIDNLGPPLGAVRTAGIVDALREQPDSVLYLVAYDFPNSLPGAWKRIAEGEAEEFAARGVESERVRIIYGGLKQSQEEVSENPAEPQVEFWILSNESPQPVPEAPQVDRLGVALQMGSYYAGWHPDGDDEARFLDAIAEALRRDPLLSVQFAVQNATSKPANEDDDELANIDLKVLAEAWSEKLRSEKGIDASRIIVTERKVEDAWQDYVEVWLLPPGIEIPQEEEQVYDEN